MKRKTRFEFENNDAYPELKGSATIIGAKPKNIPYLSISFDNKSGQIAHGWFPDKDLERFAVNILKALKSKKLAI